MLVWLATLLFPLTGLYRKLWLYELRRHTYSTKSRFQKKFEFQLALGQVALKLCSSWDSIIGTFNDLMSRELARHVPAPPDNNFLKPCLLLELIESRIVS